MCRGLFPRISVHVPRTLLPHIQLRARTVSKQGTQLGTGNHAIDDGGVIREEYPLRAAGLEEAFGFHLELREHCVDRVCAIGAEELGAVGAHVEVCGGGGSGGAGAPAAVADGGQDRGEGGQVGCHCLQARHCVRCYLYWTRVGGERHDCAGAGLGVVEEALE